MVTKFRDAVRRKWRFLCLLLLPAILLAAAVTLVWWKHASLVSRRLPEDKARVVSLMKEMDREHGYSPRTLLGISALAVKLAAGTGDSVLLARVLLRRAGLFQSSEQSDSAILCYRSCLELATRLHKDSLVAKAKNGIANYYLRKEDYARAVLYLTEALKVSERCGYLHCNGLIYNGLGLVSIYQNRFDTAIAYFNKARAICIEIHDINNEAGIAMNIANCYVEKKEYEKARECYEGILPVMLRVNDSAQIVLAYINLGTICRTVRDYPASFGYLRKAISWLSAFRDRSLLTTAYIELGTTYRATGDLAQARKYLKESLVISTGTLSKTNSMEALSRLSEIEETEGNPSKALAYFRQYTILKDSVMNDETRKSVSEIQLKYDIQKKEYQNEVLNRKYEFQKRRNITLTVIFAFTLVVVLLVIVLIWLSRKNLKKNLILQEVNTARLREKMEADEKINRLEKQKLQSELEMINRELTTTSLQLVSKNKILGDISHMTRTIYESRSMDKASFNRLQSVIQENLNTDRDWEQFRELFEKVHQDFFIHLKAGYPDLTEHDLRLCAYIKINLQNKEIARILNVSPATVTTNRYRLRKKLALDGEVSLDDFLRNFS